MTLEPRSAQVDAPTAVAPPVLTAPLDLTDWGPIEARYERLIEAPLDAATFPEWLAEWSQLSEDVRESGSVISIAYSQATEDEARREAYMHYVRIVGPRRAEAEQALKAKAIEALDAGFGEGLEADLETTFARFRADVELFRPANVPLLAEDRARASEYGRTIGAISVDFEGRPRTLQGLEPFMASPERPVRERAWRAAMDAREAVRGELDELFDALVALRMEIAANADCGSFRDYQWRAMHRFDYTPDDAADFRQAIHETFVPALRRVHARRAAALGLGIDELRPWDLAVDPNGATALEPFASGAELAAGTERIFSRVDPALGERVARMRGAGLLDLDNRPGKAPGGYCATLHARRLPFIFMNAVGTDDNVRTMLHEAGHAFHVFETDDLPYFWQRHSPMEFAEVASMSMELLTAPYLPRDAGGLYAPVEAVRSGIAHLEHIIEFMPYMAVVDGFQDWLYASPEHTRAERDAAWLDLHERFCVGTAWSGLERIRSGMWQHKLHIFEVPFYYIEYGIAQLGALQVWRNSLADAPGALAAYRAALALGGTRSLPELFEAAGARLDFRAEAVAGLVEMIETAIDERYEDLERLRR